MWRCRSRAASVASPGSVPVRNRPKCISRVARLETVLGLQVASFSSRYAVMAEAIAGVMPASRPRTAPVPARNPAGWPGCRGGTGPGE